MADYRYELIGAGLGALLGGAKGVVKVRSLSKGVPKDRFVKTKKARQTTFWKNTGIIAGHAGAGGVLGGIAGFGVKKVVQRFVGSSPNVVGKTIRETPSSSRSVNRSGESNPALQPPVSVKRRVLKSDAPKKPVPHSSFYIQGKKQGDFSDYTVCSFSRDGARQKADERRLGIVLPEINTIRVSGERILYIPHLIVAKYNDCIAAEVSGLKVGTDWTHRPINFTFTSKGEKKGIFLPDSAQLLVDFYIDGKRFNVTHEQGLFIRTALEKFGTPEFNYVEIERALKNIARQHLNQPLPDIPDNFHELLIQGMGAAENRDKLQRWLHSMNSSGRLAQLLDRYTLLVTGKKIQLIPKQTSG